MENNEKKENKMLYWEKEDSDAFRGTAVFAEVLLILWAIAAGVRAFVLVNETTKSGLGVIAGLFVLLAGIAFALHIGKALRELGRLSDENAKLRRAVTELCETHNIELRSAEEAPGEALPGLENDGYETMRIEEDGVHFYKAAGETVKCPFCGAETPVGAESCACGQRFFFED